MHLCSPISRITSVQYCLSSQRQLSSQWLTWCPVQRIPAVKRVDQIRQVHDTGSLWVREVPQGAACWTHQCAPRWAISAPSSLSLTAYQVVRVGRRVNKAQVLTGIPSSDRVKLLPVENITELWVVFRHWSFRVVPEASHFTFHL